MAGADVALTIEVAFSPAPRRVLTAALSLPVGSRVADAWLATGWQAESGFALDGLRCGVWGRVQPLDHALHDGDRVEFYRPLAVDPKEARRLRYKKQRAVR